MSLFLKVLLLKCSGLSGSTILLREGKIKLFLLRATNFAFLLHAAEFKTYLKLEASGCPLRKVFQRI